MICRVVTLNSRELVSQTGLLLCALNVATDSMNVGKKNNIWEYFGLEDGESFMYSRLCLTYIVLTVFCVFPRICISQLNVLLYTKSLINRQ